MRHKIALVIAAASLSVPVGAAVAGSPAFASTRTQSVSVAKQHSESLDSSKDTSKESSSTDKSKDATQEGSSQDTSKDTTKEGSRGDTSNDTKDTSSSDTTKDPTSIDMSAGAIHRLR